MNWIELVSCLTGLVQIAVIIWIAYQWKSQKRSEQYSKNCYHILINHWQKIEHYWYILIGTAVYVQNEKKHYQNFINKSEESIIYLKSFLRNPEIYINPDDENLVISIKKIRNVFWTIESIFSEYLRKNEPKNLNFYLSDVYCKRISKFELSEKTIKEIEKIKNSTKATEVQKEFQIYNLCIPDLEKHIKKMKNILLNYAHYKKRRKFFFF